jgi:hypothetical protein
LKQEWLKFNRYKELCELQRKQNANDLGMVAVALAKHQKDIVKSKVKLAQQRMQLDITLRVLNQDKAPELSLLTDQRSGWGGATKIPMVIHF